MSSLISSTSISIHSGSIIAFKMIFLAKYIDKSCYVQKLNFPALSHFP